MKRYVIDLAPIYPGHGGAGGGIYTYAIKLLLHLDKTLESGNHDCKFYCLVNSDFDLALKNIEVVKVKINTRKYLRRMLYIHIMLPWFCFRKNVSVLHKLASEIPFFCSADLVVTIHDFMLDFYQDNHLKYTWGKFDKFKNAYFLLVTKLALKKAKYIITPSHTIKNEAILRYNISSSKIYVAEPAADKFPELQRRVSPGAINIFYIAAYLPHKGHLKAIEVFEELVVTHNIDAKLFIRGNNGNKPVYDAVVNRINLSPAQNRIAVVPYNKNSSLADIYAGADCVWLFSEYEGFGLPLLEAQIHGIPVVCSNLAVFREVLSNNSALIINGSNSEIDSQIAHFLSDKAGREQVVEAGYANASKFSWDIFVDKILKVYTSC